MKQVALTSANPYTWD